MAYLFSMFECRLGTDAYLFIASHLKSYLRLTDSEQAKSRVTKL
jgi:hypothetical protein